MYLFFQLQILKFAFKIHLMMIYKLEGGESRVGRGVSSKGLHLTPTV